MATLDSAPTLTQFLVMKLAARRTRVAREAMARTWIGATVRIMWHLAGFSSLTIAGFMWDMIAGFVVLGISCFVMSTLTTTNTSVDEGNRRPVRRG
jgi:hypothetical protein